MMVYVVTDGDYSDYHIVGVFSTKEAAEASRGGDVEEWQLDAIPPRSANLAVYKVDMWRDGDVRDARKYGGTMNYRSPKVEVYMSGTDNPDKPDTAHICVFCWARDDLHAIKIANECRAQLIATGEMDAAAAEFVRNKYATERVLSFMK